MFDSGGKKAHNGEIRCFETVWVILKERLCTESRKGSHHTSTPLLFYQTSTMVRSRYVGWMKRCNSCTGECSRQKKKKELRRSVGLYYVIKHNVSWRFIEELTDWKRSNSSIISADDGVYLWNMCVSIYAAVCPHLHGRFCAVKVSEWH